MVREIMDTVSESDAYNASFSTFVDTASEPPLHRCQLVNEPLPSLPDPEESISPPTSSRSISCKTVSSTSTSSRLAGAPRQAHLSISSRKCPHKLYSPQHPLSPSSRSYVSLPPKKANPSSSPPCSSDVSGSGKNRQSNKSKSKSPHSVSEQCMAIVHRRATVDPPSVSTPSCNLLSGGSVSLDDPPSTLKRDCLTVWEELPDSGSVQNTQLETIVSGPESVSYYSEDSESCSSYESEGTLIQATNNALAVRRGDGDITVPPSSSDGENSRALVKVEGSGNRDERALVQVSTQYLANAVDNDRAIVPINSTLFESYDHTCISCPESMRFRFLYTFLKKNLDKKILIFFSTTNSAQFHAKLLDHFHIPVYTIHSKLKREQFINTFFRFSDLEEGILCATDAAGRDLDIPPSVDWVIQFEPPDDPTEYILRIARISCDSDRVGRSLLFLNPGEQGFLKYYHSAAIPISEFEIPKLADIQAHVEYHVNGSERLLKYARNAYGSYLIAYASHNFRDVYNVHDLNKNDVATAFGLHSLPSLDQNICEDDRTNVSHDVKQSSLREPKKTWSSTKKSDANNWMRSEKSWRHSQIKVHPKFKESFTRENDC